MKGSENVVIEPGQVWKDCDPRMRRAVVVVSAGDRHVCVHSSAGRQSSIKRSSFHANPNKSSGFVLVQAHP